MTTITIIFVTCFVVLLGVLCFIAQTERSKARERMRKEAQGKFREVTLAAAGGEEGHNELVGALVDDYEAQTKLLQKLETLKDSLHENWNGEEDYPIEEKAYRNTKDAIKATPGVMLKHWRLFPNPNGTLLLSPKNKAIAGISIGNDEFSYAAFVSDDKQISGKEPFSEQAFKSALKQIHRILGYV